MVNHLNMSEYIFQYQYSHMVNYITNEDGEYDIVTSNVVYIKVFRNV